MKKLPFLRTHGLQLSKSRAKTNPPCKVFGECGGCTYLDLEYSDELEIKQTSFQALVEQHEMDLNILPIVSSPQHFAYRNKVSPQFKKLLNGSFVFGLAPFGKKTIVEVESCPMASPLISEQFIPIREKLCASVLKKNRGSIVMRCDEQHFRWGGLGKKSLELEPENYFIFEWEGQKVHYSLDTFFQANTSILPRLFKQLICELDIQANTHLYDLYGGVGLFSFTIGAKAGAVTLVELEGSSTKLAEYNRRFHNKENLHIVHSPVEELKPLPESPYPDMTKVAIIDPPRAGLKPDVVESLSHLPLKRLAYLSCYPETQLRDLKLLLQSGWVCESITPYDFFPRSYHIESLAILTKT